MGHVWKSWKMAERMENDAEIGVHRDVLPKRGHGPAIFGSSQNE